MHTTEVYAAGDDTVARTLHAADGSVVMTWTAARDIETGAVTNPPEVEALLAALLPADEPAADLGAALDVIRRKADPAEPDPSADEVAAAAAAIRGAEPSPLLG